LRGWKDYADGLEKSMVDDLNKSVEREHMRNLLDFTGVREQMEFCQPSIPRPKVLESGVLSSAHCLEWEIPHDEVHVGEHGEWVDVEFEVALDSGAQDHVCDDTDTPGYDIEASPGSSRGACFIVGNGSRIANQGQKVLSLEPEDDESKAMKSCFQIAKVTRPLMSVGKICDGGMQVVFTDKTATIKAPDGKTVCVFTRKPGGLYICKMRLKQPFPRQG
jgi:hypothetical protein